MTARSQEETRTAVETAIGDVEAFYVAVVDRVERLGIDLSGLPLGHVAYRCPSFDAYLAKRDVIEAVCVANLENEWHGRPISKLLLAPGLRLGARHELTLIELIPPPHDPCYAMGLQHLGFVVGPGLDSFRERHADVISGQHGQGPFNRPLFVTLADGRLVKFHERSLREVTELEGGRFDGIHHA